MSELGKLKNRTAKEWAWFFHEELGYMIVEEEETEESLKKAMDKILTEVDCAHQADMKELAERWQITFQKTVQGYEQAIEAFRGRLLEVIKNRPKPEDFTVATDSITFHRGLDKTAWERAENAWFERLDKFLSEASCLRQESSERCKTP